MPSSANFTILTVRGSSSGSALSAKAERQTRSTPTSRPYAAAVATPKISPRRVISFMEAVPECNLLCRTHRWRWQARQPLGFPAGPAHFQFLKQQRRCHHRGRQAALCRAKRSQRRASKSVDLALHVIENECVAADSSEIAQRARIQPDDARAADHFFPAGFRIPTVNDQRETIAGPGAPAVAGQKIGEILL